jgi:hypothetical protein
MRRTLASILAISCLGPLGSPGAARAQVAAPPTNCIIVLDRAAAVTKTSTAVEKCGSASYLAAAAADRYQVMTWYAGANYGGWGESIYGKQGPCDRQGYRLDTTNGLGYWSRNLSSYRVYDPCWFSAMTNNQGEYSDRSGDVPYVGDS